MKINLLRLISFSVVFLFLLAGCSGSSSGTKSYKVGSFNVQVGHTSLSVTDKYGRTILPGDSNSTIEFGSGIPKVKETLGSFAITETASWMKPDSFNVISSNNNQMIIAVTTSLGNVEAQGFMIITPLNNNMLGISISAPSSTTATGQPINRTVLNLSCSGSDHFYGLGEQYNSFDQKGNIVGIWTQDNGFLEDVALPSYIQAALHAAYFPEPFILTSKPAGILISSTAYSKFDLCASNPNQASIELWDTNMDIILISDTDPIHIIQDFTGIVGRQPLSPPWVIGPWIAAELGQNEVMNTADELRMNQIPSSAIWYQDWASAVTYPNGYETGHNWISDTALYPDMAGMNLTLNSMGFKALAYFNSFVNQARSYYPVAVALGYLITQTSGTPYTFSGTLVTPESMLDVSNDSAVTWMQGFMMTAVTLGFSGWMADYGEWLPFDAFMKGGSGDIMHNQYPVLWARLNYGLMSSAIPDGDFAFFMRSGYLGSQPYQPVIWAGDQNTDFDPAFGMPTALIAALNMGVSGVPIFTYDIAGYASTSCPPSTKELYFRWTELGCFTPVMRTHRGYNVFQNWNWDSDSDTIQMFKHYTTLHVQLFPYIYTYMSRAHELGTPIMQALWLKFYNDPKTAEIDDEYMFGDNMLVAPVIIQGTTTRTLYLPAGEWYPFNGGSAIAGGISVTVDAPMDSIPVFVPAGSIIPMLTQAPDTLIPVTTVTVTTLANVITAQTIRIYPGANGGFTVYDGSVFTLTSSDSGLNAGQGIILTDQNGHTLQPCSFTDSGIVACGIISGATFKVSGSFKGNIIFTLYGIPSNPATNYRIEVF